MKVILRARHFFEELAPYLHDYCRYYYFGYVQAMPGQILSHSKYSIRIRTQSSSTSGSWIINDLRSSDSLILPIAGPTLCWVHLDWLRRISERKKESNLLEGRQIRASVSITTSFGQTLHLREMMGHDLISNPFSEDAEDLKYAACDVTSQ